ncbi:LURP-one-related/scramblase family protein [Halobacterium yunchengense]|uniref:LURP-one-related/scramblase family protein n=1 Tax=Halobacterium yunchengense TaxID=3108497 RepID=UPI00300843EE
MSQPSSGDPASGDAPADAGAYDISTVDLDGDRYEVKQAAIRNKYAVRDADGEVVLRAKQKLLKLKEEFPFVTGDGEPAFTVKAGGILDVAGTYTVTDDGTGEAVVVLDEDFSVFVEHWTIRDPETGEALASIHSKNKLLSALRHLVGLANLVPNKYEIRDADGGHVGDVSGQFSLKDTYTVTIDDAGDVPKEAVVATACVLDALENE